MFNRLLFPVTQVLQRSLVNPQLIKIRFFKISKMTSQSSSFEDALKKVKALKEEPGNDVKLKLYALYKQATEGKCSQPKPSMFDMVGKAKWDAWTALGPLSENDAKKTYASLVDELFGKEQQYAAKASPEKETKYEGLTYTVSEHITEICLNRPDKKNAISKKMYVDIAAALKAAGENDTAITVITGKGEFFSSGNDLGNFMNVEGDVSTAAQNAGIMLRDFVAAFIDFPKVLVAAVNGPAIGIPVTLLGLCDIVYASDKATFYTPFSALGQSPEGCSTYTFPKIMGYSKANEILHFGKKFTALEAKNLGLVSEVLPHDTFQEKVREKLSVVQDLAPKSMFYSKAMIRGLEKATLHKVNEEECDRLVERWQSPDCIEALMKFFQKKSKL